MSRNVGLIAVGVDHTGILDSLKGAASGALQFARWLEEQQQFGISPSISVLTDQNDQVVEAKAIQTAARDLLAVGGLDLLILYFSGHGIVKNGADEQVLLSNVKDYPDEAINIAATALNARHIGVPHVVIISDACRNSVDPFGSLGQVSGRPAVKRGAVVGIKPGKVDIFYATEPSQTAKEYKGEGFFTKVLLEALQSPPTEICETWPGSSVPIIPTWLLEDYLYNQVPTRAQQQTPRFEQTPDIIVQARQPLFLGYASPPLIFASPSPLPGPGPLDYGLPAGAGAPYFEQIQILPLPDLFPADLRVTSRNQAIQQVASSFLKEPEAYISTTLLEQAGLDEAYRRNLQRYTALPQSLAESGLRIIGSQAISVLVAPGQAAPLVQTHDQQSIISLAPSAQAQSVIVTFSDDTLIVLPVMPGYIGTVHVDEGLVQSVSFEMGMTLAQTFAQTPSRRLHLHHLQALAAAFASSAKLRTLAATQASSFADVLRQEKRLDPTLGIYAAYAYLLAADDQGVRSVLSYFLDYQASSQPPLPVPFDVALLAGALASGKRKARPLIAPFCPMMSLGWTVLAAHGKNQKLHPAILEAGKYRLNTEWSTFRRRDTQPLIEAFLQGELS